MDKKTEKLELTPEQMARVTGGFGEAYHMTPPCPKCGRYFANMLDYHDHVNNWCDGTLPDPDDPAVAPLPDPGTGGTGRA